MVLQHYQKSELLQSIDSCLGGLRPFFRKSCWMLRKTVVGIAVVYIPDFKYRAQLRWKLMAMEHSVC